MPVADLLHQENLTALRKRMSDIINDRSETLDEDEDTRLCSEEAALPGGSVATVGQLAPPQQQRGQCRSSLLLEDVTCNSNGDFLPLVPASLAKLGVRDTDVESIILKFLLNSGPHIGFEIAKHIRVPLSLISGVLRHLKDEKLVGYKQAAAAGDFLYELTESGIERVRRYWEHCTYFGSIPVSLKDYVASVHAQSVRKQNPKVREIQQALSDLSVPPEMMVRLAQAVNSGLGLFLFGAPGQRQNADRFSLGPAFGETVWIPRASMSAGPSCGCTIPATTCRNRLTAEGERA